MKPVLVVVLMVLAVMGVMMLSGCAGQKPLDEAAYNQFFVFGGEGATKQPVNLGESKDGGFLVSGGEGAAKPGIQLPQPK